MPPKPAPMTPLSQRLRHKAAEMTQAAGESYSPPLGDAIRATYLRQGGELLNETADRLDALAALRPRIEALRGVIGAGITPCQDADCEHCQADVTVRDLLALLPEEGR